MTALPLSNKKSKTQRTTEKQEVNGVVEHQKADSLSLLESHRGGDDDGCAAPYGKVTLVENSDVPISTTGVDNDCEESSNGVSTTPVAVPLSITSAEAAVVISTVIPTAAPTKKPRQKRTPKPSKRLRDDDDDDDDEATDVFDYRTTIDVLTLIQRIKSLNESLKQAKARLVELVPSTPNGDSTLVIKTKDLFTYLGS